MNSDLYKAAAKGEIEPFNQLAIDRQLGSLVTHKKNTVLHVKIIASYTQNKEAESVSTKFVEKILEKCPSLLLQVNAKADSPLHVAARYGHAAVVGALIEFAEKQPGQELESGVKSTTRYMLGMINDEENTALHEAVQSADPAFPYSANGSGETPLYSAAARGHKKISAEILEKCPLAAHEGPNGKTALHAAVCSGSRGVPKLLLDVDEKKSLTRERDRRGWTPLHYAAYLNRYFISKCLLEADKSAALIADKDRKMTALHLAAGQGNIWMVQEIIERCPECCELVDDRGWNVLHFAMVSFSIRQLKYLLNECPVFRNLIFEKDEKGNTPFHVLAAVCPHPDNAGYDIVPRKIAKGYYQAVNKQNISVEHINRYGFPELEKEIKELAKADGNGQYPAGVIEMNKEKEEKTVIYSYWKDLDEDVIGMEKASEYHLVVAALIATVTFAAAFTLPGGYKSDTEDGPNRGTAILSKNAAFQAFVISDAIAMVLSLSAVFVHFILSLKLFKRFIFLFIFALSFTLVAMAAMIVAFVTGTYAMLATPSLWLAIVTCIIGLTFFFLVIFMFYMVISKAEEMEDED
ncbi:ANK REP REGION domain-containing protein [Citrus sinensis]|uniref:ANK REP REGION domain-containing protein n=1 Tax=Citrus sinensis TaxID=2711 RepID=A0ACB8I5E7_CITSI|nr:ANK REP REGION domain-containing protein [Citrus sinensis]